MQPEVFDDQRRLVWQPSARWGVLAALVATALLAFMGLAAVVAGTNGRDQWENWTDLMLLALSLFAMLVAWQRSLLESNRPLWMITCALGGSALAGFVLSVGWANRLDGRWPTVADVGAVAFSGFVGAYLVRHLGRGNRTAVRVHLIDSSLMALAVTFGLWELVISPAVGDLSQLSISSAILTVLYPAVDVFLVSILFLLLLTDRSPARVLLFLAMVAGAVSDTAASASRGGNTAVSLAVLSTGRLLCVGFIVSALALPAGALVLARRPTVPRLLVVHGLVAAGLWLATWRYVINDGKANWPSALIGATLGGLWGASHVAAYLQSRQFADQLFDNIDELQLAQSELRQLLDDLPDALVVLSREGRIREVNASTLALTGLEADQLRGRYFTDLFSEADGGLLVELWRGALDAEPMEQPILRYSRPDGRVVLLEANANLPLRDPDQVVIALHDVSVREAEAALLEQARVRMRLAFHGAPTGMALSSVPSGVLIDVNDSLAHMLGRSRDDLIGRTIEEISHPDDWQRSAALLGETTVGALHNFRQEKRYIRGDGELVWARTWVSIMDDGGGGSLAIAHIEDVTEQRHNAERLEWAASHDGLTGLPNRFRFLERLGSSLETAEAGSVAVLFIDIDNFKVINDSLGHDAGDQLLQSMSERLRLVIRDRDLLCRFGGDEFIVMLRDVSVNRNPLEVAERLRVEIARPLLLDGAELVVTASIGITVSDREGITTTEMLRDADAAMYRAKARGRDCVEVFAPGSHDATILNLRTTNELRRGLERGEIVPYYQPIVELSNGHLIGFEVLARWRHPERGLLGPDQFLPMAEESGLIGEVGASLLRASLAQLGRWRHSTQRFADLSVSVNVSMRQLMGNQLVDVVADALAEAGVSAGALWLEITESALMADVKVATVALRDLRSLGLHLAVDDFGTGYSSLTYLKRFPVEAIKVDRTFVNGLGIDPEDSTIVEAVVNLGHSLGLTVVAEGVETPLQLNRLRELGCDRGQGYLFGRPRPAELVEAEYSLV